MLFFILVSKKMSCPLHGCKRAYTEMNALQSHIKDHEIPTQSLPGEREPHNHLSNVEEQLQVELNLQILSPYFKMLN